MEAMNIPTIDLLSNNVRLRRGVDPDGVIIMRIKQLVYVILETRSRTGYYLCTIQQRCNTTSARNAPLIKV